MTLLEEKERLRQKMLRLRAAHKPMAKSRRDRWLRHQLAQMIHDRAYQTIHAYLPMPGEIDLQPLLRALVAAGKTVVCPRVLPQGRLEQRVLQSMEEVESGPKGTRHPAGANLHSGKYDLIIVPGLAFEREGTRLGYGGGYYDTFLADEQEAHKIAPCYFFQIRPQIPRQDHDVKVDELLCAP